MINQDLKFRVLDIKEDKNESLKLMKKVWGTQSEFVNPKFYDWQYINNPSGLARIIGFFDGKKLVSQVASIPSTLSVNGSIDIYPMTLNLVTDPVFRGKNLANSLFKFFHKEEIKSSFTFGMPNNASISLHKKLGYTDLKLTALFKIIRPFHFFHLNMFSSLEKIIFRPKDNTENIIVSDSFLKSKFTTKSESTIFRVRDSAYLKWRYEKIPTRKYYKLVHKNAPDNYLIARNLQINKKNLLVISELNADTHFIARDLVNAICNYAFKSTNADIVIAAFFKHSQQYHDLKSCGFFQLPDLFRPHPLSLCVKTLTFTGNLDITDPRNWYFSLGDFDVF